MLDLVWNCMDPLDAAGAELSSSHEQEMTRTICVLTINENYLDNVKGK